MNIRVYKKLVPTTLFKGLIQRHFRYYLLLFPFYGLLHGQMTPTTLSIQATGTNISYQWYSNTINSTTNASIINSATSASYTPPAFTGIMYFFVVVHGACGPDVTSTVVAVEMSANYTWNGSVSTDWNTTSNWTPVGVPISIHHLATPLQHLMRRTIQVFSNPLLPSMD
ncbi:MAG: hypothetical protein RL331_1493 [Bacteroidota bacterium]